MKVLVACEFSQVVVEAFTKRGHYAMSCDLLPAEKNYPHYQGYIEDLLNKTWDEWDLLIAHPPCTYLANSGVRWLSENCTKTGELYVERWGKMREAAEFFNLLLNVPIPMVAVENPIQHRYARELIRKYDQLIQPWQFGHGETKATCLWLKGLHLLKPTDVVSGREGRIWREPPSPDRGKKRSRTYPGIAEAMATQWGSAAVQKGR